MCRRPSTSRKLQQLISFLTILLPTLISINTHQASAQPFIYVGCSQTKFEPDSPFQYNLNSLLSSIVSSSSQTSYNSFSVGNGTGSDPHDSTAVYGLYQCRGDLDTSRCANCMRNAVGQLGLVCANCDGARLELDGCYVRYEKGDFLGKLDTALVFKKCSPQSSHEEEFFKRRDDVLADLESGTGFRVSSIGSVEGVGQCVGDLSGGDCSACLVDAVGKLKNVCGSALAADVFLSGCYARYWASGYYTTAPSGSSILSIFIFLLQHLKVTILRF